MPFSVISDNLFVRMMICFATKKHFGISKMSEARNALLACINDFSPDGIVMHRYMSTFLLNNVGEALVLNDDNDSNIECTLCGIRTVVYEDHDDFPCNKILLVRNGEPNPASMSISFNVV